MDNASLLDKPTTNSFSSLLFQPAPAIMAWYFVRAKGRRRFGPHQRYWYQTAGYVLGVLLEGAGYSHRSRSDILYRFATLVAPYLGPALGLQPPVWESFMTDDHTPIELSWDFHTGVEKPTIRYSIEAIALDAGTATNLSNDGAADDFKKLVLQTWPDTNTAWYDHFEQCFRHGWNDEIPEGHRSVVFWAFDLGEKASTPKAYFFPGAVAHATKQTNLTIISDAITTAPGYRPGKLDAFNSFASYVDQCPDVGFEIDMLAFDLVRPEESRLKIYFRDRRTDFRSVRENMSTGGRVHGPDFEKGMKNLRKLWDILLGTTGAPEGQPLPPKDHRTAGILYMVEFRLGSTTPKVKVYIPARHYAKSDQQVIESLSRFMTEESGMRPGHEAASRNASLYSRCMNRAL